MPRGARNSVKGAPRSPREVFFAMYGVGPYQCFICRQPVTIDSSFVVHHIDENRVNDHPYNLAATHGACHRTWHWRALSPEEKARRLVNNPVANQTREERQRNGRKGIVAMRRRYAEYSTPERRSEIARQAANARWKKGHV